MVDASYEMTVLWKMFHISCTIESSVGRLLDMTEGIEGLKSGWQNGKVMKGE